MIEYLNENEGRSYPFVDAGKEGIPDNLINDLVISGPADALKGAYVSSFVKRNGLISISIAGPYGGLVVCTKFNPDTNTPYALTQVKDGVGGFISFGSGVNDSDDFDKFSITMPLDPGCLRASREAGVKSVGKFGVQEASSLTGLVSLRVSPNMTVTSDESTIYIGLTDDAKEDFVAKCDRRAIFDECGNPPIRKIAGVTADENGKLKLEFNNG